MIVTTPPHNPAPSTPRGKRRHAARPERARLHAQWAWNNTSDPKKSPHAPSLPK